jgi:hypothetical protein
MEEAGGPQSSFVIGEAAARAQPADSTTDLEFLFCQFCGGSRIDSCE